MLTKTDLHHIIILLDDVGRADIEWANQCRPPKTPEEFALEVIYVICNSGMKNTVARRIYDRIVDLLHLGLKVKGLVLGRSGKANAVDTVWEQRQDLFERFNNAKGAEEKLAELKKLPWIGDITKFHLAKNFAVMDCAKPDVHLQRLADREGVTPQHLCQRLAAETGYSTAVVDTVLWRACSLGLLDSKTGIIDENKAPPSAWA